MRSILLISMLLFLYGSCFSIADSIHFETITQEDGLSSDIVKTIYQDSYGFLWVGTINGLNRYNGESFDIYNSNWSKNNGNLACNQITAIAEDAENNLWIGTQNGLFKLNRITETFSPYYHVQSDSQSLSNNYIKKLLLDKNGNFWIGTQNGLNKLVKKQGQYVFQRFLVKRTENSILDITQDDQGSIWLGSWKSGLIKFNPENEKTIQYLPNGQDAGSLPSEKVEKVMYLKNGLLLLGIANYGLRLFDIENRALVKEGYSNLKKIPAPIYDIKNGARGEVWIGTASGLYAYDIFSNDIIYNGNATRFTNLYAPRRDQARTVYVDDNNIVWAGIGKTGLNKYIPGKNKFRKWQTILKSNAQRRDFISSAIYYDQNNIWLSTSEGLVKTDVGGNILNRVLIDTVNNFYNKILAVDENSFWASCGDILVKYNIQKEKIENVFNNGTNLKGDNRIYNFFITNNREKLWICNEKGIKLFNLKESKLIDHPLIKSFNNRRVNQIFEDNEGDYWIATHESLFLYEYDKDSLSDLTDQFTYGNTIASINDIIQDSEGIIWLGTNNGIINIEKKNGKLTISERGAELSYKIVRDLVEDDFNNIWLLNPSILIKYDRGNQEFVSFTHKDGLPASIHKLINTNDGTTMLLGEKLFHIFPPDGIDKNTYAPPVYINNLFINGISYKHFKELNLSKPILDLNVITFSHHHKTIQFNIAALNYTLPEKNQYAYKLIGFHDRWVNIGTDNDFTFMNLKAGDYTLLIKGSNNDNVWNSNTISLNIKVKPPWYSSVEAIIMYIFIGLLIFYLIVNYLLYKEKLKTKFEVEKNKAIQKYEEEKSMIKREYDLNKLKFDFFLDISHEFKTPLTIIMAHLSKLKSNKEIKGLDSIYNNAKRLEELIVQLLDVKKLNLKSHNHTPTKDNLYFFLKNICISFQDVSTSNELNLHYDIQLNKNVIYFFDRDKFYKIIFNLISNAIKYSTKGGNVNIIFDLADYNTIETFTKTTINSNWYSATSGNLMPYKVQYLNIRVVDEGVGIPTDEIPKIFERFYRVNISNGKNDIPGSGIGLSITKELIEILNGSLYVKSEKGKGTEFNLYIPVTPVEENDSVTESELESIGKEKNIILVVEDNKEIQAILQSLLSEKFDVKKAYNGKEGLEKTIKYLPDLIISDLRMDEMDGFDFIEKVKSDKNIANIPIIVLSVQDREDSLNKLYAMGIDDYINKPFNSEQLLAKVKKIIDYKSNKTSILNELDSNKTEIINRDEQFLKKAVEIIEANISNPDFDKKSFAKEMGVSESQLYKKLINLTNQSSNEFVRNIRLKKAAYILQEGTSLQIAEVGYMVGFSDPNYFSRKFKHYFGKTPSQYLQELKV